MIAANVATAEPVVSGQGHKSTRVEILPSPQHLNLVGNRAEGLPNIEEPCGSPKVAQNGLLVY